MAAFGEMVTPIVQAALVFLAIKMCFAYYVVDAGRFVSLFDLAGALALLLAYGMWLSVKTSVRVPSAERDSPAQRQAAKQPALTAAVTATRDHTFLAPSVTATLNPKISSTLAAARGERLPFGLEGST